jgi:hypothetical protein
MAAYPTDLAVRRVTDVETDMRAGRVRIAAGGSPDPHVPAGPGPEEGLVTGLWRITNLGTH